jgi:putative tryptophan/tyrosine transport system substrate-binding protein
MRRRELMTLGAAAAAWPLIAGAQRVGRRIGCLVTGSPESHGQFVAAFRQRLGELGHIEPRDFILDLRWAGGQGDRLPALADELALLAPDLVVTATTAAAIAVKRAMPAIPIVAANLIDPIGLGLVTSLARPGGNVTGTLLSFETLLGKQLELAREAIPGASRMGMLVNPSNPVNRLQRENAEATAPAFGVTLLPIETRSPEDLEAAFETFARERSEIVLVLLDAMFITERRRIAALALAARVPTMAGVRDMAEAGGLVSYGVDLSENWRHAAYFVDRILRGAKPADLPVEMPGKYELVINLKTAAALGMTLPALLLARADEVIE